MDCPAGDQRYPEVAQHGKADFLHHEVAGKAVRCFDYDGARAIPGNSG